MPTAAPNAYQKIEDHPAGYPLFAAMISSHPSLFVFRRFAAIRARMILYKQDRISQLEKQLQKVDQDEARPIQLGSYRTDVNMHRRALLDQLDVAINQYGKFPIPPKKSSSLNPQVADDLCQRTRQALAVKLAAPWDVRNLNCWVEGFGCITEAETEYLAHTRDLMALGPAEADEFLETITHKVEDTIIWVSRILGRDFRDGYSSDPDVHIFPNPLIKTASRSLVTSPSKGNIDTGIETIHARSTGALNVQCTGVLKGVNKVSFKANNNVPTQMDNTFS
ncbi:hypothetical protein O1611_g4178 [Lasiodiplodia mahajangana]|uniref:Uncharacterized protein n=1 Tax=Lasiodiplodia mahajangana TaxID=1108764 RepID=A0ACC2JPP3_9PEZI|nr:hypothetical protein O1611_g4178 [Lasiodiplodia mahajangana]